MVAPPCLITYPSSCAANLNSSTNGLTCNITNPSTSLSSLFVFDNSSRCAYCKPVINNATNSWSQACRCCPPEEFVRTKLIPAVTCSGNLAQKQQCSCLNQTISNSSSATLFACDCRNPVNNVITSLVYPSVNPQCDCDNVLLGTKNCSCCVSYDVQSAQL